MLTLATNYDSVYRALLMHFVVAPGWFLLSVVLAGLIAGAKWNRGFTWSVVWGVAFPFVRLLCLRIESSAPGAFVSWGILFCVGVLYIVVVLAVWLISLQKWTWGFASALAWVLVLPMMRVLSSSGYGGHEMLGGNTAATAVSAFLLWRATRSWIPAIGCAAGLLASEKGLDLLFLSPITDRMQWMWAASLMWNACVFASLMLWAKQARPRAAKSGACEQCGYDLRSTPGRPCPECGNAGTREGWDG